MRISKFLSENGVASRRESETMISNGRVSVNGVVIRTPVVFIGPEDKVQIDGKVFQKNTNNEKLYIFHKPIGCLTTKSDPLGRKTIYNILPPEYSNLKYIGRLDYNTSGLLLMTNSGDLAHKMTKSDAGIERIYVAKLGRTMTMDDAHFNRIVKPARTGIKIDGIIYKPMKIERIDATDVRITITEGKKNEIRIIFDYLNMPVRKLHRVAYGKYELRNLPVCAMMPV
jgi:23S rRNA pseudouridine2605 synthase